MIVLYKHRAFNSPTVYVGPFENPAAAATWIDQQPSNVMWGVLDLQDPADPKTPDWNAP